MFERYTEKARRSVFFARYEASNFGSAQIGTEHFLLGLLREDRLLLGTSAPVDSIRKWIENHIGPPGEKISTSVDLPLSEECKRAIQVGTDEANRLGHAHIAPGHLLLGLLDQKNSAAAAALREHGFTPDALREAIATSGEAAGSFDAGIVPKLHHSDWGSFASLFSPGNRKAGMLYFAAQGEARKMGSPCVETKHLLLAILQTLPPPQASNIHAPFFGVSASDVRSRIHPEPPRREKITAVMVLPTDELRHALGHAMDEASQLGHKQLGPGHLVLGLLREESCEAAEILRECGLNVDLVRRAVAVSGDPGSSSSESKGSPYV